jgi:hypothetical protein
MTDPTDFERAFTLLAVVTDAPGCKARLTELQKQIAAAAKAQAQLDGDRDAHDRAAATAEADMIAREAAVRKREVDVSIAERDLFAREQALIAKLNESRPPRYPFDPNLSGTITREPTDA